MTALHSFEERIQQMGLGHPRTVNRITMAWMALVAVVIAVENQPDKSTFFQFGPSANLILFGMVIDTPARYGATWW